MSRKYPLVIAYINQELVLQVYNDHVRGYKIIPTSDPFHSTWQFWLHCLAFDRSPFMCIIFKVLLITNSIIQFSLYLIIYVKTNIVKVRKWKVKGPVRLSYELYFFSERTVFFSHNKSANSTFGLAFQRSEQDQVTKYFKMDDHDTAESSLRFMLVFF
jgi:hypothetical protein